MGLLTKRRNAAMLAVAGLCAAVSLGGQADARQPHHRLRHVAAVARLAPAPAVADTGLGPTAPGVSDILIDAESGTVLAAAGADIPRYPASLTKLMVLDLAFAALRAGRMTPDTVLPISAHAASVEPVKLGLRPGDVITVREAILAMTTMSANDAATALGEFLGGGSEPRCAQMMTLRAHAIGMAQTQFYNASGLPNPNQITTARDLSILARDIVVGFPEDQPYFETQKFDFEGHEVYSNNAMLKLYPGATGMKTGYTILARHNLITSAVRDGKVLIGVELHEPSWGQTYSGMTALLDAGFGDHAVASAPGGGAEVASNPAQPAPKAQLPDTNRPARPVAMANAAGHADTASGWTAQLGIFSHMSKARVEAVAVQRQRGVGVPRIARVQRNGRTLWTAQLAGLTLNAAHETCNALAARRATCVIIAPPSDHMALADAGEG